MTVRLTDDVDVARGDLLAPAAAAPEPVARARRHPLLAVRDARQARRALPDQAHDPHRARAPGLRRAPARRRRRWTTQPADALELNDIARVALRLAEPLAVDAYGELRATGAFILVDEATNDTVAAGMAA